MTSFLKIALICLLGLVIVSATCHNSCNCAPNSNICLSCSSEFGDPDQIPDFRYRYCPCSFGYYVSQTTPTFVCTESPNVGNMDACEMQIVGQTLEANVLTDCRNEKDGDTNYVVSNLNLDYKHLIELGGCLSEFSVAIYYLDPSTSAHAKVLLGSDVHTVGENMTQHKLKFLLNGINKYSLEKGSLTDGSQFWNIIHIVVEMGHQRKKVRAHTYQLYVFTNRDQVQTFRIDVAPQETAGCQAGQECIVVADLDTSAAVYSDATFLNVRDDNKFIVGDTFYAQILFKDPTYTKNLLFDKLYYKTDDNQIFDLSQIVVPTPIRGGLQIAMPMVYPTIGAVIQVNMLISNARFRGLISSAPTSVDKQFSIVTLASTTDKSTGSSAAYLALTIAAFLVFFM